LLLLLLLILLLIELADAGAVPRRAWPHSRRYDWGQTELNWKNNNHDFKCRLVASFFCPVTRNTLMDANNCTTDGQNGEQLHSGFFAEREPLSL